MKIAIPVNEKTLTTEVSPVLARAYYIAVYDTNNDQVIYHNNTAKDEQGGAGVKAGQLILDLGCDTVITFRCGDNAGKIFQAAGMNILTAVVGTVETNIEAAVAGNLVELAGFHSGFHGNAPEDLQVVGTPSSASGNSVIGVRGICDGTRKSAPRGTGLGRRCLTGVGLGRGGAGRGVGCGIGRGRGAGRGLGLRDGSGLTTGTGRRMGFGDNK